MNQDPNLQKRARILRKKLTSTEVKLWNYLRKRQLEGFKFRRKTLLAPYAVDFYCSSAKIVMEIDGEYHFGREIYDLERQSFFERKGILVLRFTNNHIDNHIEEVLCCIRGSLRKLC